MKKTFTAFLATVLLFVPALCFSAYVIHLKDGREFTTDRYWEEGDQIKFKRFGGEIGIKKDRVSSIKEIDDNRSLMLEGSQKEISSPAENKDESKKESLKAEEPNLEVGAKETEVKEKTEPPKEKNKFLKAFDELKERCRFVQAMSIDELNQLDKDLRSLKSKIIGAGLAGTYAEKLIEIYTMRNQVREVLNKKNQ